MQEKNNKISSLMRIKLIFIDYIIMLFVSFGIFLPFLIYKIVLVTNINHEPLNNGFSGIFFYLILGITTYLNKDMFNGQSPGKRIFKLQVIDEQTNLPASSIKCLLRNTTLILLPIELIVMAINPNKRIGDIMVGTRLDYYQINTTSAKSIGNKLTSIFVQLLISFILALPLILLERGRYSDKIQFVDATYNKEESAKANNLFMKELSHKLEKSDFRIYNKIENDNRKYVSGILYFKNERDIDNFEESENEILKILNTTYPLDSHVCYFKFVYEKSGKLSVSQKYYNNKKNRED